MPLLITDGWWRKHGQTTCATVVAVDVPKGAGSGETRQRVTVDIEHPGGDAPVRLTDMLVFRVGPYRPGQRLRVRYAAKQNMFVLYTAATVPREEWLAEHNQVGPEAANGAGAFDGAGAEGVPGDATVTVAGPGAALTQDQLADLSGGGVVEAPETLKRFATSSGRDVESRLARLGELRDLGLIDEAEYARQRVRILESL